VVRAVLTDWLTGSGLIYLYIFQVPLCISYIFNFFVTLLTLPFDEMSLVGLALDLVVLQCYDTVGWVI